MKRRGEGSRTSVWIRPKGFGVPSRAPKSEGRMPQKHLHHTHKTGNAKKILPLARALRRALRLRIVS